MDRKIFSGWLFLIRHVLYNNISGSIEWVNFFFTIFILYFRKIQIRNMLYALYLERSIFLFQLWHRLIYHSI